MKCKSFYLKKSLLIKKTTLFFTMVLSIFIIQSCSDEEFKATDNDGVKAELRQGIITECFGKKILQFGSLADLQQEHLHLYEEYMNGSEEEQVLIDYENSQNFYSLRKKEHEMDDNIIPFDPNFDETEYTFDPVFESMLNEDGMIIIENRLYLWSSGCVIQSVPFGCGSYQLLLDFRDAALANNGTVTHQLFVDLRMEIINICDELAYDLEYVSENGGHIDEKDIPMTKNENGCGYKVILNKELVSCENGRDIFKISYTSIEPLGSSVNLNLFYINGIFGDLAQIEYGFDQFGTFTPIPLNSQTANYGYLIPTLGALSFYMSVPQTPGMQIGIHLSSAINLGTGNGCLSSDNTQIDMTCSFDMTATKINYLSDISTWIFSFPTGDASCANVIDQIVWNFGDGTQEVTTNVASISHEFVQKCTAHSYTISALVTGTICNQNLEGSLYTFTIPAGDPCNRRTYKFNPFNEKIEGKRMKLASKIQKRGTNTIFKSKFKWRKPGEKTITSVGNVYAPNANNSGNCNIIDITTLVPYKTQDGEKRNLQRVKVASINHINALDPFHVNFTHSNGFSHTLLATDLYCSE